ncbi:MAG: hypothetical protein V9G10_05380 [Candidatus Nanopelagicales bacterium]
MFKILVAAATGALVALPVTPALASGGDDAEFRSAGQCTGSARWELKVKEDDGGVEVEFEVDSNVVGQGWTYELTGPGVCFPAAPARPRPRADRSASR